MQLKKAALTLLLLFAAQPVYSILPLMDVIDTPTAVTPSKGYYDTTFTAYEEGGLQAKAGISLIDQIFLGVSFDIENAIGKENARMNVPGVIGRIKLTDGFNNFPLLVAIGYDSFYTGKTGKVENESENPFNRMVYGPYLVFTKPVFLMGAEQHIHMGVRTPMQPYYDEDDTSMFIGFDFPMGNFIPMFEIERVYFDSNRLAQTMFNFGFRMNFIDNLALELNFITSPSERANRVFSLQYSDHF